ncbi:hypothetical protein GCM10010106_17020 [Thermopolyspora flexuosa]|uniref:Uncharacterized protein (DUF2249 family) n=1 Tax=Thermopolyspora flexuosa TaxID=103836 RepID=A0A543J4G1_9ACTN|nr:DUF2249 domain-containing protein [Thermopolyspora flexuosa]TQM77709.1 uncharacterized protein (DUF2249 family) [Thermopolyspora flexuosa]GGM71325.1 hypothetical protein GCM10010106_17020 [Thermopolyspora flexuosa]
MTARTTAAHGAHAQEATLRAIRDHHRRLGLTMAQHAVALRRDIDRLLSPYDRRARMVAFCTKEVLPHALAEERTLYAAGADLAETRLLVRAMADEHAVLRELVGELEQATTTGEIAGAASALDVLFQVHLRKENDLLLPALADAGVDLAGLLDGMHEILGEQAHPGAAEAAHGCGCGGHGHGHGQAHGHAQADAPAEHRCACGGHDTAGDPDATAELVDGELDVRALPHGRRHAQIFATFDALRPGEAFVLVNDHDPRPLYHHFAAERTGEFTWDYVETGPELWKVRIARL